MSSVREGPVSLLTTVCRVPGTCRRSVIRWLNEGMALSSLKSPLCVAWQSSLTPWHQEGHFFFLNANSREFPGLVWKVHISNTAWVSTVFLTRRFSSSLLRAACLTGEMASLCLPGELAYAKISFERLNSRWLDGAAGAEGVVWKAMTSLGFHRTMSFPNTVWPEKHPYGGDCVFSKPLSGVFIYNHCTGSNLTNFCYKSKEEVIRTSLLTDRTRTVISFTHSLC